MPSVPHYRENREELRYWKQVLRIVGKRRALEVLIPLVVDALKNVTAADDAEYLRVVENWPHLHGMPKPTERSKEVSSQLELIMQGERPSALNELIAVWDGYFRGVRNENELPFNISVLFLKCFLPKPSSWTLLIQRGLHLLHAHDSVEALAVMRQLSEHAKIPFRNYYPVEE